VPHLEPNSEILLSTLLAKKTIVLCLAVKITSVQSAAPCRTLILKSINLFLFAPVKSTCNSSNNNHASQGAAQCRTQNPIPKTCF